MTRTYLAPPASSKHATLVKREVAAGGIVRKLALVTASSALGIVFFFPLRTTAATTMFQKDEGALSTAAHARPDTPNGDVPGSIMEGGRSGGGGSSDRYKTCEDMYEKCHEIGGKCTKGYPGCDKYGQTSCGRCLETCKAGTEYPPECRCRDCGFTE